MYKKDFTVKRGETFNKDIYFKIEGKPYNLAGYTAKSQIRPFVESEELIAEIECTIYEQEGLVHLNLNKEITYNLPAGSYYYDLCLSKNGVNTYYLQGSFTVKKPVTEPPNVTDNSD